MKKTIVIAFGCITIMLGSPTYAICGGSGGCGSDYCIAPESPCACTDPGWKYNDCISRGYFCRAFGNMGSNDFYGLD